MSSTESEALIKRSVEVACEARKLYDDLCAKYSANSIKGDKIYKPRHILVAASVGSYGAYLADGSEYQ